MKQRKKTKPVSQLQSKAAAVTEMAKAIERSRKNLSGDGDGLRYGLVLDAWNAVQHLTLSQSWVHAEIARQLGYQSDKTVWRILTSYNLIKEGKPDRKSLAGYYRTWQLFLSKKSDETALKLQKVRKKTKCADVDYKRAVDAVNRVARDLALHPASASTAARFNAAVAAWSEVRSLPLPRLTLYRLIAEGLSFSSQNTVWRILASYELILQGKPDRSSMGGYYQTWERILNENKL